MIPLGIIAAARLASVGGHQYWQIVGVTVAGGYLETPELQLLVGGTVVSAGITPTASNAPGANTLEKLTDGVLNNNQVYWTQAVAQDPGFYIRFDLGTAQAVNGVRQAGYDTSDRYMSAFTLQYADSPSGPWSDYGSEAGLAYPGDYTLSEVYDMVPATFSSAYQHWRLYVTANDGASYVSFSELELLGTGGADVTEGRAPYTSHQGDSAVGSAYDGIDGSQTSEAGSSWSGGPYWWQVDLGSASAICGMSLRSQRVVTGRTPTTFTLQGSASGSGPWTDVITVTGSTDWGILERRVFGYQVRTIGSWETFDGSLEPGVPSTHTYVVPSGVTQIKFEMWGGGGGNFGGAASGGGGAYVAGVASVTPGSTLSISPAGACEVAVAPTGDPGGGASAIVSGSSPLAVAGGGGGAGYDVVGGGGGFFAGEAGGGGVPGGYGATRASPGAGGTPGGGAGGTDGTGGLGSLSPPPGSYTTVQGGTGWATGGPAILRTEGASSGGGGGGGYKGGGGGATGGGGGGGSSYHMAGVYATGENGTAGSPGGTSSSNWASGVGTTRGRVCIAPFT